MYLFFAVAELGEVIDAVQDRPFVSNAGVEVMLLPVFVHTQAFEN